MGTVSALHASQEKYFPQPVPPAFRLIFANRKNDAGKFQKKFGNMGRGYGWQVGVTYFL